MSPTLKITREMTRLPLEDMLTLHEELISVIHAREEEEGLHSSYVAEIKRRVAEVKSGKAKKIDAFKAVRRM